MRRIRRVVDEEETLLSWVEDKEGGERRDKEEEAIVGFGEWRTEGKAFGFGLASFCCFRFWVLRGKKMRKKKKCVNVNVKESFVWVG